MEIKNININIIKKYYKLILYHHKKINQKINNKKKYKLKYLSIKLSNFLYLYF